MSTAYVSSRSTVSSPGMRTAPSEVRGVLGAGASLVELGDGDALVTHPIVARDDRAGEVVYRINVATGQPLQAPSN